MTPKKNRASKKVLDAEVWQRGRALRAGSITFRFFQSKDPTPPKISFIVPKTAGAAVARNSLRRRGYAALAPHLPSLPQGLVGAMVYNPNKKDEKSVAHINNLVSEILKNFL